MSTTSPRRVEPDSAQASIGDLLAGITQDMSTLVRQEVQLAKAELRQEVKMAGQSAGMFGAAGFAGYMVLLFLSFAFWWGLSNVLDEGVSALIVGVVWAVIGGLLFVMARRRMRQVRRLPQTTETVREFPGTFRGR
ncbi:phage holin family protein [Micromonospora sp. NPDC049559]|uniref:phage holin family protein n=1 Tax=Micromonospora sp. NPDC049559 TaxID=3155923 RepID=UPI003425E8CE